MVRGRCCGCGPSTALICVDIPPEEDDALGPALRAKGIAPIRLATPTTDAARPAAGARRVGRVHLLCLGRRDQPGKQQACDLRAYEAKRGTNQGVIRTLSRRSSVSACAPPEQAAAIAKVGLTAQTSPFCVFKKLVVGQARWWKICGSNIVIEWLRAKLRELTFEPSAQSARPHTTPDKEQAA